MNDLEKMMEAAFADSSLIGDFYAMLLSTDLFVITRKDEEVVEGRRILESDTNVGVVSFVMQDGTPFIPVFTSLPELQRSINEEHNYMGMSGWDLFSLTRGTDIVINPAHEQAMHMQPELIAQILDHFGAKAMNVQEDMPVMIGQPAEDPVALKKAISDVFERDGRVQSGYLCLMVDQTGAHSLVVGAVFKPGQEYPELFNIAGAAAGKHMPEGHALDFLILDGKDQEGISGALLKEENLFYRSKLQS